MNPFHPSKSHSESVGSHGEDKKGSVNMPSPADLVRRRRARWAVPFGAVAAVGAIIAASVIGGAQATPSLPARTTAQLIAADHRRGDDDPDRGHRAERDGPPRPAPAHQVRGRWHVH